MDVSYKIGIEVSKKAEQWIVREIYISKIIIKSYVVCEFVIDTRTIRVRVKIFINIISERKNTLLQIVIILHFHCDCSYKNYMLDGRL